MNYYQNKQILNSIDNGFLVVNDNLQVICWNSWFEKKTFISEKEAIGKSLIDLFPEIKNERVQQAINKSLDFGHTFVIFDHLSKESVFPLYFDTAKLLRVHQKIQTSQFLNESNEVMCLIQVFDQTEELLKEAFSQDKSKVLVKQSSELQDARKLSELGTMVTSIVHEINNPMAIIKGLKTSIQHYSSQEPFNKAALLEQGELADKMATRIDRIIKGVKVLAHNEKPIFQDYASIIDIVEESLQLTDKKLQEKCVTITTSDIPKDWKVTCDSIQLSQIIINLINNAIDEIYQSSGSPWIKINGRELDSYYEICLIDSGSGIPDDIQKDIFNPFITNKKVGAGTGLGLSISKRIAQLHKGDIYVDNSFSNTCFVLKLPKD